MVKTPKPSRQYVVCYNEFALGMGYGWTAPIISMLKKKGEYTLEDLSWIGSIHEFGRMTGPILSVVFLDRIGRKKCLILCALLFFTSWLGLTFVKSVFWICVFRLIFGMAAGFNDATSSVYLGENYPSDVRGVFCSFVMMCFCAAELFQYIAVSLLDYNVTSIMNSSVTFIGILFTTLLVETPQFLLMRNKHSEALKNFKWLRAIHESADSIPEFDKIKKNIEEESQKKASFRELISARANYKSLIVVFVLNILATGTGYSVVLSYMTTMFSSSGILSEYGFTVLYGVVQLIACSSASLYIERCNRRTIVLYSFALTTVLHAITATLLYIQDNMTTNVYLPWLIFSTITVYGSNYAILFTAIHMIRGEIFPQSIKAIGSFIAVTVYSGMSFITARLFLTISSCYGMYFNFLLYAVVSLAAFIYNYFQLPETRGKLLVDIQKNLEK